MSAVPFKARVDVLANESEQALYDIAVAALTELSKRLRGRRVAGLAFGRHVAAYFACNRILAQLDEEIDRDTEIQP